MEKMSDPHPWFFINKKMWIHLKFLTFVGVKHLKKAATKRDQANAQGKTFNEPIRPIPNPPATKVKVYTHFIGEGIDATPGGSKSMMIRGVRASLDKDKIKGQGKVENCIQKKTTISNRFFFKFLILNFACSLSERCRKPFTTLNNGTYFFVS